MNSSAAEPRGPIRTPLPNLPFSLKTAVEQQRNKDAKAERHRRHLGLACSRTFTQQVNPNQPPFPASRSIFVSSLLRCSFLNRRI